MLRKRSTSLSSTVRPKKAPGKARESHPRRPTDKDIFALENRVFKTLCQDVNSPVSLYCLKLAEEGRWQEYVDFEFDVMSTSQSVQSFRDDYFITSVMKKNPRLPLKVDKAAVALTRFHESESMCRATNTRLRSLLLGRGDQRDLERLLKIKNLLSRVLPPLTPTVLKSIESEFRFGPGATSCVSGSKVMLSQKYATSHDDATPRLMRFLHTLSGAEVRARVTESSALMFVPKNAKTDRSICIEPHWNVFVQLGIGAYLKKILTRLGLSPNDQERNRTLAKHALTLGLATIDLSMASDTIAYEVVRLLLPDDWFHLLNVCRTDYTILPGGTRLKLEKFSSMGNGFTWELECLIFWACSAALGVSSHKLGIFGDDIILPIDKVPDLLTTLNLLGFKVNTAKSFWQSDFRESCGTDWYRGQDVRPFFFKRDSDDIQDLRHYAIHLANGIRYHAHRSCDGVGCDYRYRRAWLRLRELATKNGLATYTSYGYSDEGLVVNFDEATPSRSPRGFEGYTSYVYSRRPVVVQQAEKVGAYLAALHRGYPPYKLGGDRWWSSKPDLGLTNPTLKKLRVVKVDGVARPQLDAKGGYAEESPRGWLHRLQLQAVTVIDWYHLGPWI